MTRWVAFALVTNAVLVVVLALARATQAMTTDGSTPEADGGALEAAEDVGASDGTETPRSLPSREDAPGRRRPEEREAPSREDERARSALPDDSAKPDPADDARTVPEAARSADITDRTPRERRDLETFSTGELLANVAITHGTLGGILVAAAWLADVPARALGVDLTAAWSTGAPAVLAGVAVGIGLYVANELVAANLDRVGVEYNEDLRDALGPGSLRGWLVLLVFVLPVIAAFEELLFRAALIGALSAGFGLSPWLLAVLSSIAFGVGHGIQGLGGMLVTGTLGFVLAAAFVLTESLLVVVIAHYLINALEFLVHEGLGIDWAGAR